MGVETEPGVLGAKADPGVVRAAAVWFWLFWFWKVNSEAILPISPVF